MNVRKLLRRRAELEARLVDSRVDLLFVQETWLSDAVEEVAISGFLLVGRLDRTSGAKHGFGGIAIYARIDLTSLALLEYVESAERMYCILHTHIGAILLSNWYRPPDDDGSSLDTLSAELHRLQQEVIGTIILGDLNVHHRQWLRHSNGNTALGERLWDICRDTGLKQIVDEPTRGAYVLDLVLSDLRELLTVRVLPELADHKIVCVDLDVAVPLFEPARRTAWDMKFAQWDDLRSEISAFEWSSLLIPNAVDSFVVSVCDQLSALCSKHIPTKVISVHSGQHPWLDDSCHRAIEAKCAASGTPEFHHLERTCSAVLTVSFRAYQQQLRQSLSSLPKASKEWWKVSRELLNRKSKVSTIASLKDESGMWVLDPKDKANLLARKFQSKCILPPRPDSADEFCAVSPLMSEFCLLRTRWVLKVINSLKDGKASGPDKLPVRLF